MSNASAQTYIPFFNASLEDVPAISKPPFGWFFCGALDQTPPDVQPNGFFGHTPPPFHGQSYVAMVTRNNGSTEAIGQRLNQNIEAATCYSFSMMLARSANYVSFTADNYLEKTNFNQPIGLKIWAGNSVCDKAQLLAITPLVQDTIWQKMTIEFTANRSYSFIVFEAFCAEDSAYAGNILLDALTPLIPINCETQQNLVAIPKLEVVPLNTAFARFCDYWQEVNLANSNNSISSFSRADGQMITGNKSIYLITEALAANAGASITIGLTASNRRSFLKKQANFLETLLILNVSAAQISFKRIKPQHVNLEKWDCLSADGNLLRINNK